MNEFVGGIGHNVLLKQHFDGVGNGLEEAKRTGAVWSEARLHSSHAPPLNVDNAHHYGQDKADDDHGEEEPVPPESARPVWRDGLKIDQVINIKLYGCH
ncbi:hypothetical protein ES703_76291 [subsurface metagenome]